MLTTSGTAAVELHPAVVEAHHARVPLLLVTADRPPELQDVGAPQTIDQTHLFGRAVRWFAEPGVPDSATRGSWRSLGARAVAAATGVPPGRSTSTSRSASRWSVRPAPFRRRGASVPAGPRDGPGR